MNRGAFSPIAVLPFMVSCIRIFKSAWRFPRRSTGLFEMIVGVLTTCHTQYTWDSSICTFYLIEQHFNFLLHTLQVLYMCTLCDSTNINTTMKCKQKKKDFSLPFAAILVNCAPSGKMRNYCTPHIIKENFENFEIHRCNYILLSQVYCVWQVVTTPTIVSNNPLFCFTYQRVSRGSTVVNVLCYKSEGSWIDPRWCHWNFSLT